MQNLQATAIERFHAVMKNVPHWIFSVLCLIIILWLTLAPHPFGEEELPLFPGADKIAHGLMFFGLTLCMLFDYMRHSGWKHVSLLVIAIASMLGMGLGIGIEFFQRAMGEGRSYEIMDMAADSIGAIVAGGLFAVFSGFLEQTEAEIDKHKEEEASKTTGNSEVGSSK